jgi:hypothetical protein
MSLGEAGASLYAPRERWREHLHRITFFLFAPVFCSINALAQGSYGGPVISGVPYGSAGARTGRPDGISYFGGVSGSYDNAYTPYSVDSSGNLVQTGALWGVAARWGVFGTHQARRYTMGVDYSGAYHHYNQNSYFNGLDSVLALDFDTQISNRMQWLDTTQAGSLASAYGAWAPYAGFLPGVAQPNVPVSEIYDHRTYFVAHTDSVTYMLSPRVSVTAAGNGNFIRRQSNSLAGAEGYGAYGSVSYRLNRRDSVSLNYAWNHFDYTHEFGEATINELFLGFMHQISRHWTAGASGGAFRIDTAGLASVPTDPAVAALFGQATIAERYYAQVYYPSIAGSLRGGFRRYAVTFAVAQRPSPGNGVYLASNSQSVTASLTYSGIQNWSFSANAYYTKLKSVAQQIAPYGLFSAGAGASYHMYRYLHATVRADSRVFQVDQSTGNFRPSFRVEMGLAWSPSELPLSLW